MTWKTFLTGYVAILVLGVGTSIWAERALHVDGRRMILGECALLFLLAATRVFETLYLIVRNAGWFSAIESDSTMRAMLAILGLLLAASAVFLR